MPKRFRPVYITFSFSICVVAFLIFFNISRYFGTNPLNNAPSRELVSIFPQGWSFFTKSSAGSLTLLYKVTGKDVKLVNQRNFSPEFLFGLDRNNRIVSHELSFVYEKAAKDSAKIYKLLAIDEDDLPGRINSDTLQYHKIQLIKDVVPDLQGKYLIVSQARLPWFLVHKKPDFKSNFLILPVDIVHI